MSDLATNKNCGSKGERTQGREKHNYRNILGVYLELN